MYYHVIDETSPFYEVSEKLLNHKNVHLELLVFITATIESTGTTYRKFKSVS